MPDVDLRLILIVHLIQNQLVLQKGKNAGIGKTWDYSGMSS